MAAKRSKKPTPVRRPPIHVAAPRAPMPGATMTRRDASAEKRCVWGGGRYDPADRSDIRGEMVCGCETAPGQAYCLEHLAKVWAVVPVQARGLFAEPGTSIVLLHR